MSDDKIIQRAYGRLNYQMADAYYRKHHLRFARYVESSPRPLVCQACGGSGGWIETVCELGGPFVSCGWCEGTGLVTRWIRGAWLRVMRDEARNRRQRGAA